MIVSIKLSDRLDGSCVELASGSSCFAMFVFRSFSVLVFFTSVHRSALPPATLRLFSQTGTSFSARSMRARQWSFPRIANVSNIPKPTAFPVTATRNA